MISLDKAELDNRFRWDVPKGSIRTMLNGGR